MEEKKYLKISLGTGILITIVIILIIALVGMYFYYNPKKDKKIANATENLPSEMEQNTTTNISNEENIQSNNTIQNTNVLNEENKSSNNIKNPYEKYTALDLEWYFNKKETEINVANKRFAIKNGILYVENDGKEKELKSITEKAKYITCWGINRIERIYVLTEEGNIWKMGGSNNINRDMLYDMLDYNYIDEFHKILLPNQILNMTDYGEYDKGTIQPYFLLSTGELVDSNGITLDGMKLNIQNNTDNTNIKTEYFRDNLTELELSNEKFIIRNGILYIEKDGVEKEIKTITEKAKYITYWGVNRIERIYVLTEEGNIFGLGGTNNDDRDMLYDMLKNNYVDEFHKIDLTTMPDSEYLIG